jgi:single-strand DNA-binding protein
MLNKVFLMGRLTRDPELRFTQTNVPVVSFTLAVDRSYRSKTDQQITDFIDIVAWRSTAEFISKWFSKGRMMVVAGSLQIRTWQDRDGNNRRTAEVVADEVYFGDSKRFDGEEGRYAPQSQGTPFTVPAGDGSSGDSTPDHKSYSLPASDFEEISDDDDELPF